MARGGFRRRRDNRAAIVNVFVPVPFWRREWQRPPLLLPAQSAKYRTYKWVRIPAAESKNRERPKVRIFKKSHPQLAREREAAEKQRLEEEQRRLEEEEAEKARAEEEAQRIANGESGVQGVPGAEGETGVEGVPGTEGAPAAEPDNAPEANGTASSTAEAAASSPASSTAQVTASSSEPQPSLELNSSLKDSFDNLATQALTTQAAREGVLDAALSRGAERLEYLSELRDVFNAQVPREALPSATGRGLFSSVGSGIGSASRLIDLSINQ